MSVTCSPYPTENVIWENQWGGADIRRGGDPVLRNNFICHGYSDGVVVGERGRGLIEGNHIYCRCPSPAVCPFLSPSGGLTHYKV